MWNNVYAKVAASRQEYLKFERVLQQMRSITEDLEGPNLDKFREALKSASVSLGRTSSELASGVYEALQTNIDDVSTALNLVTMASKAATLGATDTTTVMKGLLAIMNAYGVTIRKNGESETERWIRVQQEAAGIMDKMFILVRNGAIKWGELDNAMGNTITSAARMGYALDDVMAAVATLTKQGLSPSKATTALNNLLTKLVNTSGGAENAAASLGITFSGVAAQSLGLHGMLTQINIAISQNREEIEALAEAGASHADIMEALTRRTKLSTDLLVDMFPDLRTLRGAAGLSGDAFHMFAEDLNEVKNSVGELDKVWTRYLPSMPARLDRLNKSAERLAFSVWGTLFPAMVAVGTTGANLMGGFATGFVTAMVAPVKAIQILADSVNYLLALMGDPFNETFGAATKIIGGLTAAVFALTSAIVILDSVQTGGAMAGVVARLGAAKTAYKNAFTSIPSRTAGLALVTQGAVGGAVGRVSSRVGHINRRAGDAAVLGASAAVDTITGRSRRSRRAAEAGLSAAAMGFGPGLFGRSRLDDVRDTFTPRKARVGIAKASASLGRGFSNLGTSAVLGLVTAIEAVSMSTTKATVSAKNWRVGLGVAGNGMKSLGTSLLRGAAIFGVWGIAAAAVIGLVVALGVVVARNSDKIKESFGKAWESGIKPFLMNIGRGVFTVLNKVLEYLSVFVNFWLGVIAIFADKNHDWKEKLTDLGKIFVTALIEIAKFWTNIFVKMIDGAMLIFANFRVGISKALHWLLTTIVNILVKLWEKWDEFWDDGLGGALKKMGGFLSRSWEWGKQLITNIGHGIAKGWNAASAAVKKVWNNLFGVDDIQAPTDPLKDVLDGIAGSDMSKYDKFRHGFDAVLKNLLGGEDWLNWMGFDQLRKVGWDFGTRALGPVLDKLTEIQSKYKLTFGDLLGKYGFEPVQLSLGNFDNFLLSLKAAVNASDSAAQDRADHLEALDNIADVLEGMDSTLAGKNLSQSITMSPYIAIHVAGDIDEAVVRERILPVVNRALADEARRIGIAAYSG